MPHGRFTYLGLSTLLASISLVNQQLLSDRLSLLGMDRLHKHLLILELVTLSGCIQFVVQVSIDLFGLSILAEKTSQNSLATHPKYLERHTCVHGTLSLSVTGVATLGFCQQVSLVTRLGVHGVGCTAAQARLDDLADRLARVGVGDLVDLIGVEPNLWWKRGGGRGRGGAQVSETHLERSILGNIRQNKTSPRLS